jgi:hydroxymethylglutaryl-CoA lyase
MPTSPLIVEVSPRDGLQNEATLLDTATKVELVQRSIAFGARRIEVTSFVNPERVPQMADAEAVLAALPRRADVSLSALVLNERGFERAAAAGVDEINFVVVATDTFNRRNQGVSTDESITTWERVAARAHGAGIAPAVTIAAAFGCPFEGDVPAERVATIARKLAQSHPFEIALADTIGVGVPSQVVERLDAVADAAPGIGLRCHFHNTRNTGIANADAAAGWGVGALDASVGGIGGCPFAPAATGNIATEDLTYLLERSGMQTGIDLDGVVDTARWVGEQLGKEVAGMLSRAGLFPPRTR